MTLADIQHDPFIQCYQAWIQEKHFLSATGADFLASFSNTSGRYIMHSSQLLQGIAVKLHCHVQHSNLISMQC